MAVTEGTTVQVHYTGRLENGEVFDTSEGRDPLEFEVGSGLVVPGFEESVKGLEEGDTKTFTLPPDAAYGERDERLVRQVPRQDMDVPDLEPGHVLQVRSPDGNTFQGIVTDVGDEEVTLDFNHFLAGRTLVFEVQVVAVR